MLSFFRKYQKFFFIIITVCIVISFVFFGTVSTFQGMKQEVPNRDIGKLIDGSTLKEKELYALMGLLQKSPQEGGYPINLLAGDVLQKEIVLSGLGELLAEHYFEALQDDLALTWKKAKHFSPYVHPFAPSLSARVVWNQFSPELSSLMDELSRAEEEFSKENLQLLFKLYKAQSAFPPSLLLQVLSYWQAQNPEIKKDPHLMQGVAPLHLHLFGFQTIEEWFGPKFIQCTAQFILNTALLAEKEGYEVAREKAALALRTNVREALEAYKGGKEIVKEEEVEKYFSYQIHLLGLAESQAALLWKKVMSFCSFFKETREAVFVEPLSLYYFKNFASPSIKIKSFTLPSSLQFADFLTMLKFQRYIEIVAECDKEKILTLPSTLFSAEMVSKTHPELVVFPVDVLLSEVNKSSLTSKVSLKQRWQWEIEEENFAQLQEVFPELKGIQGSSIQERTLALEKLESSHRLKADLIAAHAIVDNHPEWIDQALKEARKHQKTLRVSLKESEDPFSGEEFLKMIESDDPILNHFSKDGEHFYLVEVLDKTKGLEILSFEEALKDHTLDHLLDELLFTAYSNMNFLAPYEGVKTQVGAKVYADLLNALRKQVGLSVSSQEEAFNLYAVHRFDLYLEEMKQKAMRKEALSEGGPFSLVVREEVKKQLNEQVKVGEFSSLNKGSFFEVLENDPALISFEEIEKLKAPLKKEAEKALVKKILAECERKVAIAL